MEWRLWVIKNQLILKLRHEPKIKCYLWNRQQSRGQLIFSIMSKTSIFSILLTLSIFQVCGQTAESSYSVSIYLVTRPGGLITDDGRLFSFKADTLSVWNNKGWFSDSDTKYDTAYYTLTNDERDSILRILKSPDTLKSAINPCILDGLILSIFYENDSAKHTVWISNAYNAKLFTFIDIVNKYVSEHFRIYYNKDELIRKTNECFTSLQKRQKS